MLKKPEVEQLNGQTHMDIAISKRGPTEIQTFMETETTISFWNPFVSNCVGSDNQ